MLKPAILPHMNMLDNDSAKRKSRFNDGLGNLPPDKLDRSNQIGCKKASPIIPSVASVLSTLEMPSLFFVASVFARKYCLFVKDFDILSTIYYHLARYTMI